MFRVFILCLSLELVVVTCLVVTVDVMTSLEQTVRLLRPLLVVGVLRQVCVRVCSPDVVARR